MKETSIPEKLFMLPMIIAFPLPLCTAYVLHDSVGHFPMWAKILLYAYAIIYGIGKSLVMADRTSLINHYLLSILALVDLTLYLAPLPTWWAILMQFTTSYFAAINIWTHQKEEKETNRKDLCLYIEEVITKAHQEGMIKINIAELERKNKKAPIPIKKILEQHGKLAYDFTDYKFTLNEDGERFAKQIATWRIQHYDPILSLIEDQT